MVLRSNYIQKSRHEIHSHIYDYSLGFTLEIYYYSNEHQSKRR